MAPLRPHCSNNVVLGGAVEVGEDMEMGHEEEEACATHQDDHHNTREVLRSGPLEFSGGELEVDPGPLLGVEISISSGSLEGQRGTL